jgi:hypothetical protein
MPLQYTTALLTISTLNFERSVQFYRQLLNQEPGIRLSKSYAEFQLPGLRLGIFRPKHNGQQGEAERQNRVAFTTGMALCLEVENLAAAIEILTQLGYPPPGNIMTASHGREIYACDPDQNWLILHESQPSGD